jgi:hypothetical protein
MNTGKITNQLYQAILQQFPKTDMNWLLKGESGETKPVNEPVAPYSRSEKAMNAKVYLERDLVIAQTRVADQLERLGNLLEKFIAFQMEGKNSTP